jgi:hypothetical protein
MPRASRRERSLAWYPLLFAAYPVLYVWSLNTGEASAADVVPYVLLAVVATAIPFAVLALLFRDARRAALIAAPIAIGALAFGQVATIVRPLHVRPVLQIAVWAGIVGLGILGALLLRERQLRRINSVLNGLSVVLVIVTLVLIVPSQLDQTPAPPSASVATQPVSNPTGKPLRDVYYVILDRYGSDSALNLRYGVEKDLTPWLSDHGFRVLPDSHANYVRTPTSLAATLNMTQLDGLETLMGKNSPDYGPIFTMLQNSLVVRQFKALGYATTHIGSYYSPTRSDSGADQNLNLGGLSDFGAAVYERSAIRPLLNRLHLAQPRARRLYQNKIFGFQALESVKDDPGPKFVFAHLLVPHPPLLVARDGSFRNSAKAPRETTPNEYYKDQLAWTNDSLKAWIQDLQALPEAQRPIIIIQADEGPYPLEYERNLDTYDWSGATPATLQEKYGILNAWYVPDGTDPGLYDSMTSVNTFPTLFSGYFGVDIPKLPDRVYTSARPNRPYDLTDVTDRLESWKP